MPLTIGRLYDGKTPKQRWERGTEKNIAVTGATDRKLGATGTRYYAQPVG